jgi:hypothetical protein
MGREAAETARNINQAFGQGIVKESTAQHGSKDFHNGDESFEVEEGRGRHSAIDDNQLRVIF